MKNVRRIKRPWRAKFGTCPRFRDEKTKYLKRAVAEFDRNLLAVRYPVHVLRVFRCAACDRWHIGKVTDGAIEPVEANS